MIIPQHLDNILVQNRPLHGAVELTLSEFEPWVKNNKVIFFPDYTDHGPDHIAAVFKRAASLITDNAYTKVTPEDVATLLLSILVHDIGMHLTKEGFSRLIQAELPQPIIPEFNQTDRPWLALWEEFLHSAERWNAKKRENVFGDPNWMRRPPKDPEQWNGMDFRLIGEFVRLHHPRLAHEIARFGVPSNSTPPLVFIQVPNSITNLAGMIARSHGTSIREAIDWLPREERRVCYHVHVPYLMALLRIADYLQIESERAPQQLLQVQSLLYFPVKSGRLATE